MFKAYAMGKGKNTFYRLEYKGVVIEYYNTIEAVNCAIVRLSLLWGNND